MDTSDDRKKLRQIEASYPVLEASIADLEGRIKERRRLRAKSSVEEPASEAE